VDRIGLQNDAFALSKAGILPTVETLVLVKAYHSERDFTVWSDLAKNLGDMSSVWSNEINYADFKRFVRGLFGAIGKKLGWDATPDENALDTLLRTVVLNQLGSNDDKLVIEEANKRFYRQLNNNESIPADLRFFIYKTVVGNGTEKEFEAVYNIFKTADLHEERLRALRALGYTQNTNLIARTLDLSLTEEVRSQDLMYVTIGCISHRVGREMAWKFLQDHFVEFDKRLSGAAMLWDRVIGYTIAGFTSEERAQEIEKFFKEHPVPNADRTIKQSLETIRANAKWVANNRESVATWLAQQ